MRTPKKLRRFRNAPIECYNYGRGLRVAVYASFPPAPKHRLGVGEAARGWSKTGSYGRRVVLSVNGHKIESGRCPRCGRVTNGSGDILPHPDAGEREHTYCPPCLKKQIEDDRERAVLKHELLRGTNSRIRAVVGV